MTIHALSSYWMSGRDKRLLEFFAAGTDLGFESFEQSGIHHDTFYDEVRPEDFRIVSLHDPAPPARGHARIGSKELRRADIVYTSLDETRRRQAVALTQHSIDVAVNYGAHAIVLHLGQSSSGAHSEKELRQLYIEGRLHSPEAAAVRSRIAMERWNQHAKRMEALHRSLDELVVYAAVRSIRLGLENRPAHEIAGFSEMGEILSWYSQDADTVGYWHDTGHAQVQANLGFTPHVDWLLAYDHRIMGMHLHDAEGVANHRAPGNGNVDWAGLASLVPANAIRVIEVDHSVSVDALRAGVTHLRATGWLNGSVSKGY